MYTVVLHRIVRHFSIIFDCIRDMCGLEFYVQFKGPLLWIFKIEVRVAPQNNTKYIKNDEK